MTRPKSFLRRAMTTHALPLWTQNSSLDANIGAGLKLNELLPHTKEAGDDPYELVKDIYDPIPEDLEREWHVDDSKMPYLRHVKSLSTAWPHLRYLAQWMEATTSPIKWKQIRQLEPRVRQERAERTRVAAVDFVTGHRPKVEFANTSVELSSLLAKPVPAGQSRLYVVEDLSRNMIEQLGMTLDIDPLFFRDHINDYWWYNTRDPWVELPDLNIVSRHRSFFRLTFVQPRYFKDKDHFAKAKAQAGLFNVLRRLDDDSEHKALFDDDRAIVALVRSKASIWSKPLSSGHGNVGVLLIDPSIKNDSGFPLWQGYRPFENSPPPSEARSEYDARTKESLFKDLIFWVEHMSDKDIKEISNSPNVMAFRIAQIICSEWLILGRYIMARLGQIEWELERPDFRKDSNDIDASLAKLHTWRRRLPLYRIMVADTIRKLFPKPKPGEHVPGNCMADMRADFDIVSEFLDELYDRTERIGAVATAVTAIEESRRAMDQNHSLGRLTYLAAVFAPLSFFSSFFSMSGNLEELGQTFWVFFTVAVPVSIVAFVLVNEKVSTALLGLFRKEKIATSR